MKDAETYTQPPHNLEAEQALLGALLVNNDVILEIDESLKSEDFYEPVHGDIFNACVGLISKGQKADPVKLKPYFEGDERLNDVQGTQYLVRLCASAASIINARDYAKTIIENANRRTMIELAYDIIDKANTPDFDGTKETQGFIEDTLSTLRNERLHDGKLISMAGAVQENYNEIEQAIHSGIDPGIRTGIKALDKLTGGFRDGHLILIAGRPAMGKTALMLEIMRRTAINGYGSLMFSMEMEGDELAERMISTFTAETDQLIEYEDMSNISQINQLDLDHWNECAQKVTELPCFIRTGKTTVASIRRAARSTRAKLEAQGKSLDIIFVDYIQKMKGSVSARKRGRYEEISEISGELKDLAEEFKLPIIVAAQLNRDLEKREDKTPQLSDLRDSGYLEQDANLVIFPFREEIYINKEKHRGNDQWIDWNERMSAARGLVKIILAKKRRGKIGDCIINVNIGCNYFYD